MTADETSVEVTEKVGETAKTEGAADVEETAAVETAEDIDGDGAAPSRFKRFAARAKTRSSGKSFLP